MESETKNSLLAFPNRYQNQIIDPNTQKDKGQHTFEGVLEQAKNRIGKVLEKAKNKLNDQSHLEEIGNKLKLLNCEKNYLIEEGLINLYMAIYDEKKKAKKTGSKQMGEITINLLGSLQDLIKYFFLQHELRQLKKYRNLIQQNFSKNLEGQETMQEKIRMRISSKKCSQLFKDYLKNQQANKNKELCRICYKQIDISQLAKHVECCGKKNQIKEQMHQNYQIRMEIIEKMENFLLQSAIVDLKSSEIINKIIQFYRSNNNSKKKNTSSYNGADCPLFFYEQQITFGKNQCEVELLTQLAFYQDKAFCLKKKLLLIQNESFKEKGLIHDPLKYSLNQNFRKSKVCQQACQQSYLNLQGKKTVDTGLCNFPFLKQNLNEIKLEDIQKEVLLKVPPKIKKRLSNCQRYSIETTKSDSNASQTDYCSISINDFQILKLLGKGSFGKVYLVRRTKTKDFYALKVIKIDKNWGENQLQFIKNQYGVYKKIAGDHLVTATFSFQQRNAQFFVLQYMPGGDLARLLQENVYLEQAEGRFYLAQILLAIQHLHCSDIIHRDLKPQNIVLDSKGHIKLTDFGLSQIRVRNKIQKAREKQIEQKNQVSLKVSVNKKSIIKNKNEKKLIGTPDYIAPQIIQGISLQNPAIDWWSFGVIAYEMLIGCRPFCANSVDEIIQNIQKGQIQFPQIGYEDNMLSPLSADLIKKLLKKNFQERLGYNGAYQIKNHEFFKGIDWQNLKKSKPPLISSMGKQQNIELLAENKQLRRQIQILINSQTQNKLQQLKNYVRYDLLKAETIGSIEQGTIKKKMILQKLKSIASNFQKCDRIELKYKPAMSSQEQSD